MKLRYLVILLIMLSTPIPVFAQRQSQSEVVTLERREKRQNIKDRRTTVELGDSVQTSYRPSFAMKFWDGEAGFRMRLAERYDSLATFLLDTLTRNGLPRRRVRTAKVIHDMYFLTDGEGAFEWEMILPVPPDTNIFYFDFQSYNLRFLYQPPLSIPVDSFQFPGINPDRPWYGRGTIDTSIFGVDTVWRYRPDSVGGSYAVYHATKRDNIGYNEYMTGKAMHIYRPRAVDAAGDTTWCDIQIDTLNTRMRLRVPKAWLINATFPVNIDPTFGNTTLQSTGGSWGNGALIATTGAVGGQIDKITAAIGDNSNGGTAIFTLWEDSGAVTRPIQGPCLDSGAVDPQSFTNVNPWHPVIMSKGYELSASTIYHIGGWSNAWATVWYDAATGSPTWTNGSGCSFSYNYQVDELFSVYASYNLPPSTSGDSASAETAKTGVFWAIARTDTLYTADDKRTWSSGGATEWIYALNFSSLIIPKDATIDSIIVIVEGNGAGATAGERQMQASLYKGDAFIDGDTVLFTLDQTTDNRQYIRGSTDGLWGTTWTPTELTHGTSGIVIRDKDTEQDSLRIDQIMMRAYWTTHQIGYGTIGANTTTLTTTKTLLNRAGTSTQYKSTGAVGDRLDSIRVYAARNGGANDSVLVSLYYMPSTGTQLLILDTIVLTGGAAWYSTTTLPFVFTDGIQMGVAVGELNDPNVTIYYDNAFTNDGDTSHTSMPNPYSGGGVAQLYSLQAFYTPMTYSWGGPSLKTAAAIDAATLDRDAPNSNYGVSTFLNQRTGSGAYAPTRDWVMRLASDPRTAGYTQDSARLYLALTDPLDAADDSLRLDFFILNKVFVEGTKNAAAASAGEVTWDSAQHASIAWTNDSGATSITDHTPTDSIAYLWVDSLLYPTDSIADVKYLYVSFPGSAMTDDFITYGIVCVPREQRNVSFLNFSFGSDDNTVGTNLRKPFWVGWESAPGGGKRNILKSPILNSRTIGANEISRESSVEIAKQCYGKMCEVTQ